MRHLLAFSILLVLPACGATDPCGAAAANVRACGGAAAAESLAASCDASKADEIATATCDDLQQALGDGKTDGWFGWKQFGQPCSYSWTCADDLLCLAGICTYAGDPTVQPGYGKAVAGATCGMDGWCASGLLCNFGTCGTPLVGGEMHGAVETLNPDPSSTTQYVPYANVAVTAQRFDQDPMWGGAFLSGPVAHDTTGSDGIYRFTGLRAGYYHIVFSPKTSVDVKLTTDDLTVPPTVLSR